MFPPVAVLAGAFVLGGAGTAAADVGRLVVDQASDAGRSPSARIVVRGSDGRRRTLGPFRLSGDPSGLLPSPDGRRILLTASGRGAVDAPGLLSVPTDGGGAVPLRLPPGVSPLGIGDADTSWSPDGEAVLLGDAIWVDPAAEDPQAPRPSELRVTAVRCEASTGACVELPDAAGAAPGAVAGVPGGTIVSSSILSLLSTELFGDLAIINVTDEDPDSSSALTGWHPRTSAAGRRLLGLAATGRTSSTWVDGATRRTIGSTVRSLSAGLPYTSRVVAGPSGALLLRSTLRTRVQRRGRLLRLLARTTGPRLLAVGADGTSTVGALPPLRVSPGDLRRAEVPRGRRDDVRFLPAIGLPDGRWLGTAGTIDGYGAQDDIALATMDAAGRARVLRIAGRATTSVWLLRRSGVRGRRPANVAPELVGYERATDSAVVRITTVPAGTRRITPTRIGDVTLRVPLDGGRPTVVAGLPRRYADVDRTVVAW